MASDVFVNTGSDVDLVAFDINHNLNQSWLITGEVFWYSPEVSITGNAQDFYSSYGFEKY